MWSNFPAALGVLAAIVTWASAAAADAVAAASVSVPGRVAQVTLYREQALVTRTIPVDAAKGAVEIVVSDLPEQVVPESLFAEGSDGVEVRAVRFRTRAIGEEPREEVRKLDEALAELVEKSNVVAKNQELLAKQTSYLDQLEGFAAPAAKSDLARGVLDAAALQKITTFSFDQRKLLTDKSVSLAKESKELKEQIELFQRKRAELTSEASRTIREALLFLETRGEAKEPVRLSYLVGNCGWSPAYTFRADAPRKQVRVECNGLVHQMTGEDWSGVQLTLSTASPALSASRPGLAAFPVILLRDGQQKAISPKDLEKQLEAIRNRRTEALQESRGGVTAEAKSGANWALNQAANQFQNLELVSGQNLVGALQAGDTELGEGPSLSYPLPSAVSLASRSDQQIVQIFLRSFDSRFYFVATPVLTRHVFREAEMTNASDQDLLAGPLAVYLESRFVGTGEIPTVARGQMFVPGFGIDPQLRARRELVEKTESTQGGNRRLDFKYRLTVENYQDQAAPVRLYDRLPVCEGSPDVRVTLSDLKDPLATDPLYLRRERLKGILRWDIEVAAGSVREKARTIEYGFSVEFDRNFQLGTLEGAVQRELYEKMDQMKAAPAAAPEVAPPIPAPSPAP